MAMCSEKRFPTLFAFSANPDLAEKENNNGTIPENYISGWKVYYDYLHSAFEHERICNIFITGDLGVGKSSLIRSFDKVYHEEEKKNFLYLSLGKYHSDAYRHISMDSEEVQLILSAEQEIDNQNDLPEQEKGEVQPIPSAEQKLDDQSDNDNSEDVLERRLLMQIYSYCHQKDLPASSFRMIQENRKIQGAIILYLITVVILLLISCFYSYVSEMIKKTFTFIYGQRINQFTGNRQEILDQYRNLLDDSSYDELELVLSFGLMILIFLGVCNLIIYCIPRFQLSSLKFQFDKFEAECEHNACEDYLDHHITEIVYCLETIAPKIKYTIVIEDLDRIGTKSCVEIFSRLREINNMLNIRLASKHQKMRFVYIVNDHIISNLQHSKFADYVLSVIPSLNHRTSLQIFTANIEKINKELNQKLNIDLKDFDDIIAVMAPYLTDYRMQFAVINEYSQLFRLYYETNPHCSYEQQTAKSILALSFYKNLFPDDYADIRKGKSRIFPDYNLEKIPNTVVRELFSSLRPWLNIGSLYYIGYPESKITDFILCAMNKDLERTLNEYERTNYAVYNAAPVNALKRYSADLLEKLEKFSEDSFNDDSTQIKDQIKNAVIMTQEEYNDVTHFVKDMFNAKIYILAVIKILSESYQQNKIDKDGIMSLYDSLGLNIEGNESVFYKCKLKQEQNLRTSLEGKNLSREEYEILCLGVGKGFYEKENFVVYVGEEHEEKMVLRNV